jgi:hypothetical protein
MQEVGDVQEEEDVSGRNNSKDPETRKGQKEELKEVERLSRSKEDRSADGAREAAVESSSGASEVTRRGHACQFAKWRWPAGLPGKDWAGLRRMRHQLRPGGVGQETMEGRMVSKARLEASRRRWRGGWSPKRGLRPSRASTPFCTEELPLPKMGSKRFAHKGIEEGHAIRRIQQGNRGSCFVHKWTFLDSLAVPCLEI